MFSPHSRVLGAILAVCMLCSMPVQSAYAEESAKVSDSTSTAELLVRSPCFCFARSVLPPRSVFGPDLLRAWQNLAAAAVSQADKMQAAHALIEKYDTDKVRAPHISSTPTIFRSAGGLE